MAIIIMMVNFLTASWTLGIFHTSSQLVSSLYRCGPQGLSNLSKVTPQ